MTRLGRTRLLTALITVCVAMVLPAVAFAHLERPSYWPDPAPDTSVSPPAGGKVPEAALARIGRQRLWAGQGARGLPGPRRLEVAQRPDPVDRQRAQARLPAAAEPAQAQAQPLGGDPAVLGRTTCSPGSCAYNEIQPAVNDSRNNDRVVVMPGRLHRADLARAAAQRPALRLDDAGGLERRQDAQLPLPGHLPQRPEPDPRPGPRGARHAAARARRSRTARASPTWARACAATSSWRAAALQPTDVIIDGASDYESDDPEARPHTLPQARDRARRPRGRVRRAQLHRARGARARPLHRGDRRLPDRHGEDVLEGRLRQPDLHLRPRPLHRLRRVRRRRRRPLPGRRPRDRRAGRQVVLSGRAALSTRPSRDCDMRGSVLAYSGSMGNAVRITHNNIYGNTAGISTDTISAAGHPGFPADSVQVDHN